MESAVWSAVSAYLVASGFDDICGRVRNSSRSIVPELSYRWNISDVSVQLLGCRQGLEAGARIKVQKHTLSSFMNLFLSRSTSSRSTGCQIEYVSASPLVLGRLGRYVGIACPIEEDEQLVSFTMLSRTTLVVLPIVAVWLADDGG